MGNQIKEERWQRSGTSYKNALEIRVFCTAHNLPCENVGNGEILHPTTQAPWIEVHKDGWMVLDASEYACPEPDLPESCVYTFEVLVGD